MAMNIIDGRPQAYQGDFDFTLLRQIMLNSIAVHPISIWNNRNDTVTITKGAHTGTFYPDYSTNYYFDVRVNNQIFDFHCLIPYSPNNQSAVIAVIQ